MGDLPTVNESWERIAESEIATTSDGGSASYISIQEFSRLSSLSDKTIRRRVKAGDIPAWQPGGPGTRILIPISCLSLSSELPLKASNPEPAVRDVIHPLAGPKPRWTNIK